MCSGGSGCSTEGTYSRWICFIFMYSHVGPLTCQKHEGHMDWWLKIVFQIPGKLNEAPLTPPSSLGSGPIVSIYHLWPHSAWLWDASHSVIDWEPILRHRLSALTCIVLGSIFWQSILSKITRMTERMKIPSTDTLHYMQSTPSKLRRGLLKLISHIDDCGRWTSIKKNL